MKDSAKTRDQLIHEVAALRQRTRELQQELRESKERFRQTVDLLPTIVVEYDLKGLITYINDYGYELLGYSPSEVEGGYRIPWLLPPGEVKKHMDRLSRLIKGEKVPEAEYQLIRKDGSIVHALIRSAPIYEDGNVTGIRSTATDITERKQAEDAVSEIEHCFRTLVETMRDGLGVQDENGIITYVNQRVCELSGYSKDELIGRPATDLLQEPDRSIYAKEFAKRREGASGTYELTWTGKDGRKISTISSSAPLFDAERNFKGSFAVITDITERKRVEERMSLYQEIFAKSNDGIAVLDSQGRYIEQNSAHTSLLGYTTDELIGETPVIHLGDETFSIIYQELLKRGSYRGEVTSRRKSGEMRDIEISAFAIRKDGGEPLCYVGIKRDVTERKLADDALRKEKEKYRLLVEGSPLGISIIGEDGYYKYLNPKFVEIFGYKLEDIPTGREWFKKAYPDEKYRMKLIDSWLNELKKSKRGEVRPQKYTVTCKDGSQKIIHFRPVTMETGDQFVMYEDVTEYKQAEDALRKREAELETQSRHLEEVNAALRVLLKQRENDKVELEEKVLSNVKELVLPYLERLKKSGLDANQSTYVNILESNLEDIISPFVHKLTSAYLGLTPTEIHVANLVKEGKDTKTIAEILHISPRTIESHRQNIRKKLGLRNKNLNLRTRLLSIQ